MGGSPTTGTGKAARAPTEHVGGTQATSQTCTDLTWASWASRCRMGMQPRPPTEPEVREAMSGATSSGPAPSLHGRGRSRHDAQVGTPPLAPLALEHPPCLMRPPGRILKDACHSPHPGPLQPPPPGDPLCPWTPPLRAPSPCHSESAQCHCLFPGRRTFSHPSRPPIVRIPRTRLANPHPQDPPVSTNISSREQAPDAPASPPRLSEQPRGRLLCALGPRLARPAFPPRPSA